MKNSKVFTIFILIIVFIYFLFSQFYLKNLGSVFTYLINPLFFIILALAIKSTISTPYKTSKYKKSLLEYVIITVLIYSFVYLISGLFLTFGKNPYSTGFKGLVLNIYSVGLIVFCKEYIRYKIVNNNYGKDKKWIFVLIIIAFTMEDVSISLIQDSANVYFVFKLLFTTIIPSIIKNVLFTFLAEYTDYVPAIIYDMALYLLQWIPPILPNAPWVFSAVMEMIFPIILLIQCKYYIESKDKMHLYRISNPVKPKGLVTASIAIVIVIWFAVGIFPIKPIGIASGSMSPTINMGDMVIILKCNANDIKVDDVIEYKRKDFDVVHRVIEIYKRDGVTYFITKGDNNDNRDKDPVEEKQLVGKAIGKIPFIAWPTIWINTLSGKQSFVDIET